MVSVLLTKPGRFYRVEVGYNLFGEYSVLREWGTGRSATRLLHCFSNLGEACLAAERWARQIKRRGYTTKESFL